MLTPEFLSESLGSEESYDIRYDEDECSVFADGSAVMICTNWAIYARRVLGDRVEIFGFHDEENPGSSIANSHGGHDFAVVDERWIVDGWVKAAGEHSRSVFDLDSREDEAEVVRLYGDRSKWSRCLTIEESVDKESEQVRQKALSGVTFQVDFPPSSRHAGPAR